MINQTIDLLGHRGKDRVTGFSGTISSVCFDLYGCVQLALTPSAGTDGKLGEGHWFDVNRVEITSKAKVMATPTFAARDDKPSNHESGPAEKPAMPTRGPR